MTKTKTETALIPATREEVVAQLNTLGTMTTSTEWERSALVYSLTADGRTLRNSRIRELVRVSFKELASWGIVGLSSHNTVAAYHKHWQDAVNEGLAEPAEMGDPYVQPQKEWPGFPKVPVPVEDKEEQSLLDQALDLIIAAADKLSEAYCLDLDENDRATLLSTLTRPGTEPVLTILEKIARDFRPHLTDWRGPLEEEWWKPVKPVPFRKGIDGDFIPRGMGTDKSDAAMRNEQALARLSRG